MCHLVPFSWQLPPLPGPLPAVSPLPGLAVALVARLLELLLQEAVVVPDLHVVTGQDAGVLLLLQRLALLHLRADPD